MGTIVILLAMGIPCPVFYCGVLPLKANNG